jgi:hypothetical protein
MAMTKGSVTINPTTGAATGTGAAFDIFTELDSAQNYQGITGTVLAAARKQVADLASAIAVIITYIKTNAVVTTTVTGTTTSVKAGSDTAPTTGTGTGTVN